MNLNDKKFLCFVAMSYNAPESDYLRKLLRQLPQYLHKHNVKFVFADEMPLTGLSLKQNLLYNIKQTDFMLSLFDGKSINVFWEIGIAEGLGMPCITAFIEKITGAENSIPIIGSPSLILLRMDENDKNRLVSAIEYFLDGVSKRQKRADTQIFICHRSIDKTSIDPIAFYLDGMGYSVWYDSWDISPGDSIPTLISQGIENSTHFLIFLSKNTQGSSWVTKELNTALSLALERELPRIIPVFLDNEGRESLPTLLRELRGVRFYNRDLRDAFDDLQKGLEKNKL